MAPHLRTYRNRLQEVVHGGGREHKWGGEAGRDTQCCDCGMTGEIHHSTREE